MIQEVNENKVSAKPPPAKEGDLPKRTVLVRYGKIGLVGQFRHSERSLPSVYTRVVVQTDRGLEMGEVISPSAAHRGCTCILPREKIDSYVAESGPDYPFSRNGRMVRLATVQDLNEQRHIEANALKEAKRCKELIKSRGLPMKIVEVEHLFGGDRIIYFFMAEGRVDFRGLVRELAQEYNTRIEMRQVGSRDEARLVGDFDTCGRELCCKKFLKVLQPVSMRMAKVQQTTLDPSKISGRCGRLKCCLRYEDVGYRELSKRMPRIDTRVVTEQGAGRVIDALVLTQLVKVRLEESNRLIAVNIEELLSREDKPSWKPPGLVEKAEPSPAAEPRERRPEAQAPAATEKTEKPAGDSEDAPKKNRRRRRRRRNRNSPSGGGGSTSN